MAGSKRLSWGLLGTARINRAVIRPIQSSKKSQLTSVASRNLEKAISYAKNWGIPVAYGSYEELLADPSIDVIYNSLPNSLHAEWSIKAMQRGKHVLCEKPLATSVQDVDRIIEVADKTGTVIAEAFMYRHHPQTLRVKQMVDEGEIGKLQLVRGIFCYTNTRPDNPRLDPALGGGSLWDVGCYPIGYARYLAGEEPETAFGQQVTHPMGVDVLVAGQLSFPGGAIAQIESGFTSPANSTIEITGEKARIFIPVPYKPGKKTRIQVIKDGNSRSIGIKGAELYQGEIEDMEDAILHGTPTRISLADSRANIAVIEGLYESAQRQQPISLTPNKIPKMEG